MEEAAKTADTLEWERDNTFGEGRSERLQELCDALLGLVPANLEELNGAVSKALALSLKGRALCASSAGNTKKAKEGESLLCKCVKMNPKCTKSWNALGHLYWEQGNLKQAYDAYEGALSADPKDSRALRDSALVLRSLGGKENIEKAVDRSKSALTMDLSCSHSWYTHGMVQLSKYFTLTFDQKDLKGALKAFDLAEKHGSGHPDIHMNRGQCQKYMILWEEALKSLDAAIEKDSTFEEAKASRADLQEFFDRLTRKWDAFAGYNEKTLAKAVKSLPSAPGKKSIRGNTVSIMPVTDLQGDESQVTEQRCVALRVLEVVDGSAMPLIYLAVDANRTRCLIASYGIDAKAIQSGAEVIYGNPCYYRRTVPGDKPWEALILVIDRSSPVTIGGRLLERGQWSQMALNVTRKLD
eukprot:TRINITY_DN16821_c0_g1_i2.p1 TRINITY_DN16821_c0_g1~~TRINITY_DN16821_c0_g1_i2.p1  ORF type:complete len:438 (+),score=153.75 TRINITY_DN16821_c0_g1_i2:80-1315(+)